MEHSMETLGSLLFAGAVLHTFFASKLLRFAKKFKNGSGLGILFHILGEVELVFGIWAAVFLLLLGGNQGPSAVLRYLEPLHFAEPIFVFCIMVIAASKPVLFMARFGIQFISDSLAKLLKLKPALADTFVVLTVGPLFGSLITEPAAMTVTALLLNSMLNRRSPKDSKFFYALLAVLFVNVSIGGALTHFAAPPILMVARTWNWDLSYVLTHFGWKATAAVLLNGLMTTYFFRKEILEQSHSLAAVGKNPGIPIWILISHLFFLIAVVLTAHEWPKVLLAFVLFLALTYFTKKYQERLRFRESLLVAFFLAGIILFGEVQGWWLSPLITKASEMALYLGACALTAVTDNAALTYLGAQVSGLSASAQYYLVAGAIAGGGLTLIANAPNAAGFSLLEERFSGLNALRLLRAALIPTLIAILALGYFPDL